MFYFERPSDEPVSKNRYINFLIISIVIVYLMHLVDNIEEITLGLSDFHSLIFKYGIGPFFEILLTLCAPIAFFLFWKKNKLGWIILGVYLIYNTLTPIVLLIWEQTRPPYLAPFETALPKHTIMYHMTWVLLYFALFIGISNKSILLLYNIKLIVAIIVASVTFLFVLVAYWSLL